MGRFRSKPRFFTQDIMKTPACPSLHRCLRPLSLTLASLLVLAMPGIGRALNPAVTKLTLPPAAQAAAGSFGTSVAMSDTHVVVGDPDDGGGSSGAVHIFDARTGRYLRRLAPATLTGNARFGGSVALSGATLVVGASGQQISGNIHGTVYVFDLRTGRLLHELVDPATITQANNLGWSVSISGRWIVAGAPGYQEGANSWQGASMVFDAVTGDLRHVLVAADGQPFNYLGESVAISGDLAIAGAYAFDGPGIQSGAAYVFDIQSGGQLQKLMASDSAAGHNFGKQVALSGKRAWVSAHGVTTGAGSVYEYDLMQGGPVATESKKWVPADGVNGDEFGSALAVSPSHLAVGASQHGGGGAVYVFDQESGERIAKLALTQDAPPDRSSLALYGNALAVSSANEENRDGNAIGAVYLARPVTGPLGLRVEAATGSAAPRLEEVSFRSIGPAFLNGAGSVAFQAGLAGPGATRGRGAGLWTNVSSPGATVFPSAVGGLDLGNGVRLLSIGVPLINDPTRALFQGVTGGGGVTRANRSVLFSARNTDFLPAELRTGQQILSDGGALAEFREVVQGRDLANLGNHRMAVAHTLQRGVAGVGADRDSGVLFAAFDGFALLREVAREGEPAPAGSEYREFFGRVASTADGEYGYPAWHLLPGATRPVQGLFSDNEAGDPAKNYEREGSVAGGTGGAAHAAFLAETMNTGGYLIYRASLRGNGVARGNNEMLRHADEGLIARKGAQPDAGAMPGVVISRFLAFWPVGDDNSSDEAVFLAALSGPGVTRNNDLALFLWDEYAAGLQLLLREGQPVHDAGGPSVGVIQRVDVDPVTGKYVVLASLTGNRAKNQALFTGDAGAGNATTQRALRAPSLRLRKGTLYRSPGAVTGIRSMTLSPTTDRGGAGGKGLGQVINRNGEIAVAIEFDNRLRELMTGKP